MYLKSGKTIIKAVKLISMELKNILSGEGDLTQRLRVASDDELVRLINHFSSVLADNVADIQYITGESEVNYNEICTKLLSVKKNVERLSNMSVFIKRAWPGFMPVRAKSTGWRITRFRWMN